MRVFPMRGRKGDGMVFLAASATAAVLLLFATLIAVVAWSGLRAMWVPDVTLFRFEGGVRILGVITDHEGDQDRFQIFTGNRDVYGLDYRWVDASSIIGRERPEQVVMLERVEKGAFFGFLESLDLDGMQISGPDLERQFTEELARVREDKTGIERLQERLSDINTHLEQIRQAQRRRPDDQAGIARLRDRERQQREIFARVDRELEELRLYLSKRTARLTDANGRISEIALMDIVSVLRPNQMSMLDKLIAFAGNLWGLLWEMPRESNTEGGLFPAIMGTVLMVLLMSVFCVPLGVLTAVYLHEYATEGRLVNLVRIAVNNLAGVPSIVYGMFGLGFFVYWLGGSIDALFFAERLPIPTYGTGGLLWCSLTMALLTVPVVIVSTEEGLNAVPREVRLGSIALGATRFQTLYRVVLPMATPGILTGLILAIARAAGEVAPLMLVGVAKVAPGLPLDGDPPFLHLDRKIMHLGFHIYDVGFQSPDVDAAKPMVYMTTLLLLLIVLGMSALAMYLRNLMRKRYALSTF